jgi:hypothetical protein
MAARYDDEGWTWDEFLEKMDYEGGICGMMGWGGPGCFPPEIRPQAEALGALLDSMEKAFAEHGY